MPKDSRAGRTVHWVGMVTVLSSGVEQGEHEDEERGGDEKVSSSDSEEVVCRTLTSHKKGREGTARMMIGTEESVEYLENGCGTSPGSNSARKNQRE